MIVFRLAVLPKTGSMQHFFRLNCNIFKMAAKQDSKENLLSSKEESRNLDEYLDDSEAEKEKISKNRKSKITSSTEKTVKTWLPEASIKVLKTRKTFL